MTAVLDAGENHVHDFQAFRDAVSDRFTTFFGNGVPLFTTGNSKKLFAAYLECLPDKQEHNCQACQSFLRRFGGLVTIDEQGKTCSVLWNNPVPEYYQEAVNRMRDIVQHSLVTGIFYSAQTLLGKVEQDSEWTHLTIKNPVPFTHSLLTDRQFAAERIQSRKSLIAAGQDYPISLVEKALAMLET